MENNIYLTKVLYRYYILDFPDEIIYLDLFNKEIIYEFVDYGRTPDAIIKSGKGGFKPIRCKGKYHKDKVVFSKAIKISDSDYEKLLPYCIAKEFEDYRNGGTYSGIGGYYDEGTTVSFEAYSDSFYPYIKWDDIQYTHPDKDMCPYERLMNYINVNFLR